MAKAKRNGEGTINQRKDGRWCGQMVWGRKPDGKMDRRTVYGDTYDECRKKLNELISERDKGKSAIKQDKISVGDFALDYYLTKVPHKTGPDDKTPGISNKTWNWYIDMVNWYIKPNLSDVTIGKFNQTRAQQYINDLCNDLSAGTVGGVKRTLNRVMNYAVENHYIGVNPLKGVDMPKMEQEDDEDKALFVEKDDLKYIIEQLVKLKEKNLYMELGDILLTCVYTGMRISEVMGLRIRDIDLANNIVRIRKQSGRYKTRDKKGKVVSSTKGITPLKTIDSLRTLPISKVWRNVLNERLKTLKGYKNPDLLKPDSFVFCTRGGNMRTYSGTRSMYLRFMKRIGLEHKGYTLHSFRHSFISHAKAAKMDKDAVTRYVGHASSEITNRIYTHLTEEEKAEITGAIDKTFGFLNE